MLIVCTDNLNGFEKAILSIFPLAQVQSCIIHQIRNTLKYVSHKDRKAFMSSDLKQVYQASKLQAAELAPDALQDKWQAKYPIVIKSWRTNWDKLSVYFQYAPQIRQMIYTTNTIEGYHRQLRKVTKNKGVFPSDMALFKIVFPLHAAGLTATPKEVDDCRLALA